MKCHKIRMMPKRSVKSSEFQKTIKIHKKDQIPLVFLNNMHYKITFTILSRKINGKRGLNRYKYTKFTPQNIALHL